MEHSSLVYGPSLGRFGRVPMIVSFMQDAEYRVVVALMQCSTDLTRRENQQFGRVKMKAEPLKEHVPRRALGFFGNDPASEDGGILPAFHTLLCRDILFIREGKFSITFLGRKPAATTTTSSPEEISTFADWPRDQFSMHPTAWIREAVHFSLLNSQTIFQLHPVYIHANVHGYKTRFMHSTGVSLLVLSESSALFMALYALDVRLRTKRIWSVREGVLKLRKDIIAVS
jgi:hypothetical protein